MFFESQWVPGVLPWSWHWPVSYRCLDGCPRALQAVLTPCFSATGQWVSYHLITPTLTVLPLRNWCREGQEGTEGSHWSPGDHTLRLPPRVPGQSIWGSNPVDTSRVGPFWWKMGSELHSLKGSLHKLWASVPHSLMLNAKNELMQTSKQTTPKAASRNRTAFIRKVF